MSSAEKIAKCIELSQQGDKAAFAEVVRHYQALISGITYNITGDFHKSEDLAQETFLVAWNKLGELTHTTNITAWLCTIARNLAKRSYRKKTERSSESLNETVSSQPDPATELLRREQSELVWSTIEKIPDPYRETLILYYRSGQSVKNIAEATGVSEESVRQRLVRARKSLKSQLESMIGNVLHETVPGEMFTFSVLAALPGVAMLSTVAEAATTGTAATGAVATGSATSGKAGAFAAFWSVLGPLSYFLWIFLFLWWMAWANVRNAPTLNCRRYQVYSIFWWVASYGIFCVSFGILMVPISLLFFRIAEETGFRISGAFPVIFVVMFGSLIYGLVLNRKLADKVKRLAKYDLGFPDINVKLYPIRNCERYLQRSIWMNVLLLESFAGFALIAPIFDGSGPWYYLLIVLGIAGFIGLAMYGYYLFGQQLLNMCRTKEGFMTNPPLIDDPFGFVFGRITQNPASVPILKKAGAMGNVIKVGWISFIVCAVWFITTFIDWERRPIPTTICIFLIVAIIGVYIWAYRNKPSQRELFWLNFVFFFFTGIVVIAFGVVQSEELSIVSVIRESFIERGGSNIVQMMCMFCGPAYIIIAFIHLSQFLRKKHIDQPIVGKGLEWLRKLHTEHAAEPETLPEDNKDWQAVYAEILQNTPSEPDAKPLAFPRKWIAVFIGYGVLILVVFSVLSIFTEQILGESIIRQKYIRNGNYTALIAMEPDNPQWYYERGAREHVPQHALKDLDVAISMKSDYVDAYIKRAEAYKDWNSIEGTAVNTDENAYRRHKALEDCNKAIQLDPENVRARFARCDVYTLLGDFDAAISDADKAIDLKGGSETYFRRAIVYVSKKDYIKAIADCKTAINLSNDKMFTDYYKRYLAEFEAKNR